MLIQALFYGVLIGVQTVPLIYDEIPGRPRDAIDPTPSNYPNAACVGWLVCVCRKSIDTLIDKTAAGDVTDERQISTDQQQ